MKLTGSYGCSVLILHGWNRFRKDRIHSSWLFLAIVGSVLYAAVPTWYSMKHDLKFEQSMSQVLMWGVSTFVGSAAILIFLSLPTMAWLAGRSCVSTEHRTRDRPALSEAPSGGSKSDGTF